MNVGAITFGPTTTAEDRARYDRMALQIQRTPYGADKAHLNGIHACNCIGPQHGEKKCPCALAAEAEQGARMVKDGVVINGLKYRLVLDDGVSQ